MNVRALGDSLRRVLSPERAVKNTLARCDIRVGGDRPWDLRVHDRAFYWRLALNPAFELGETYMDGLWDCPSIDGLVERLMRGGVGLEYQHNLWFSVRSALARVWNRQSLGRARVVAVKHYDLGVDLFRAMLDPSMTYTCALWDSADTLDEAQAAKLRAICERLELKPGERLLDVGCGFGGLAEFAATQYDVTVLAITNARDHHEVARERCARLPGVEVALMDYRELPSLGRRFDKVSSIEMIEAVGPRNYHQYMDVVGGCLEEGGRFLLQSLISPRYVERCNDWFDRYIFPNGVTPTMAGIEAAATRSFGRPVDLLDMGSHYAPTLLAWDRNFEASWPLLSARYDERFRRMWHFYLTCMAGFFRADGMRVYQILYRRPGRLENAARVKAEASGATV